MCPNTRLKAKLPQFIVGLASHKYTYRQAMESTGYKRSRLAELVAAYRKDPNLDLTHGNTNRSPANKISAALRDKIVQLYFSDTYKDTNFSAFRDMLKEFEGINICYQTLRNIMREYGIKSPEARHIKRRDKVHLPRERRENEGDLLQLDATPFQWFYKFGDKKYYTMHGAIDDATSKPTSFYMTENECSYGYFEVLRETINNYGIPRQTYTDRAAIFCVTPKEKRNLTAWEQLAGVHDKKTQWQRVLDDLGIDQILAWSPQAKGRVERMWHTVQDWLPTLFFKLGINTMDKANAWLPQFVRMYQNKWSVPAKLQDTFYVPATGCNLDEILTVQIPRTTDKNGCFSFHSYKFAVLNCDRVAYQQIMIYLSIHGIKAKIKDKLYDVRCLDADDNDCVYNVVGDKVSEVVKDIIYRYYFAYAKEISA